MRSLAGSAMPSPVCIVDNVYLGNERLASNEGMLSSLHIVAVVNVTWDVPCLSKDRLEHLCIPVEDKDTANIMRYFDTAAAFIEKYVSRNESVLVHCQAGVSRSPTIILAYLMKCHGMNLKEAFTHFKTRRPYIFPNIGFWRQLLVYEESIFGKTSVKMVVTSIGFMPDVLMA